MFLPQLRLGFLSCACVLAATASANTHVVGPDPGADFPDIPSAIAAVQPGDVLLVQPAVYWTGGTRRTNSIPIVGR